MLTIKRLVTATAATLMSVSAMAATVVLDPSTLLVNPNGSFTVDVVMDASDAPGDHPGIIQGNFTVSFDDTLAQYDGFTFVDASELVPSVTSPGDVPIGFTSSPDIATIGTLEFTALGGAGDVISLSLSNTFGISTFVNLLPANVGFQPEYTGADITVVPVPAAVWLMISALGVLGGRARRKS